MMMLLFFLRWPSDIARRAWLRVKRNQITICTAHNHDDATVITADAAVTSSITATTTNTHSMNTAMIRLFKGALQLLSKRYR